MSNPFAPVTIDVPRHLSSTLSSIRHGRNDPTTHVGPGEFWHATITPSGPGVLHLRWRDGNNYGHHDDLGNDHDLGNDQDPGKADDPSTDESPRGNSLLVETFGPGGQWLTDRASGFVGDLDRPVDFPDAPDLVRRALKRSAAARLVATHNPYHQLLPVVLAQRITAAEAIRQWHRLVRRFGTRCDLAGVPADLYFPPSPDSIRRMRQWDFHRLGIEQARARPLVAAARHFDRLFEWADSLDGALLMSKLQLLDRIGPWTAASVCRVAVGDPDVVIIGDFHFPHAIGYHLTGRPRSTDDEMVELLAPYEGHRGRVQRAIVGIGSAPKFGPRKPIVDIAML